MKQLPTLPDNIAKEYECLIVPTKVILQNPRRVIDLTRIKPQQAEALANEGKYLVKKEKKAEPKVIVEEVKLPASDDDPKENTRSSKKHKQ